MAEHPIIFSSPMILALLDGRKTQTRRIIKPQPTLADGEYIADCHYSKTGFSVWKADGSCTCRPVKGVRFWPGDRLWVRENFIHADSRKGFDATHAALGTVGYLADGDGEWLDRALAAECKKRPSIHMPRWASRLTLTVTDMRVQRLQEISEEDAIAEGCKVIRDHCFVFDATGYDRSGLCHSRASTAYSCFWSELHGQHAWAANPWIVALTFTVAHGNIDALPKP